MVFDFVTKQLIFLSFSQFFSDSDWCSGHLAGKCPSSIPFSLQRCITNILLLAAWLWVKSEFFTWAFEFHLSFWSLIWGKWKATGIFQDEGRKLDFWFEKITGYNVEKDSCNHLTNIFWVIASCTVLSPLGQGRNEWGSCLCKDSHHMERNRCLRVVGINLTGVFWRKKRYFSWGNQRLSREGNM